MTDLKAEIEELRQEIKELKKELEIERELAITEVHRLDAELDNADAALAEKVRECDKLKMELEQLRAEFKDVIVSRPK